MASADPRTADRHRDNPIQFRPLADEREWLLAYAKATGRPVNVILKDALRMFRASTEPGLTGGNTTTYDGGITTE